MYKIQYHVNGVFEVELARSQIPMLGAVVRLSSGHYRCQEVRFNENTSSAAVSNVDIFLVDVHSVGDN